MAEAPFIKALTTSKDGSTRPLTSILPQRNRRDPSLLALLARSNAPDTAPPAKEGPPASNTERESALAARLCASLAELERARAKAPDPLNVADLAMTVARAVLNHELKTQRDALRQHIEDACRTVEDAHPLSVRLHPDLADIYLKGPRPDPYGLEVVPDATLEPGGIIVEGERSAADASVQTRLAQFREALSIELQRNATPDPTSQENVA